MTSLEFVIVVWLMKSKPYEPVYYAKAILTNKKIHYLNKICCPVILTPFQPIKAVLLKYAFLFLNFREKH